MATRYVFPRQPTILAGRDYFDLSHNNLFISANVSHAPWPPACSSIDHPSRWCHTQVSTAHVIPDDIDIVRFDNALARTLSVYPLCAGRLVRPDTIDQPWRVRLNIF